MNENVYAAPQAEVADLDEVSNATPFYVVAQKKFAILYLTTMGLYGLYWFYKNWRLHRDSSGENIWPIARTLFSIFFVHALFRRLDDHAQRHSKESGGAHGGLASLMVVLLLISQVLDRASMKNIGSPVTDILSLLILIPLFLCFSQAQRHINRVSGDPLGQSNAELSPGNIAWLTVGLLLWALSIYGIFL